MSAHLFYTGAVLDRAAHLRREESWFAERLRDGESRVLTVWRDNNLIHPGDEPRAAVLTGDAAREILDLAGHVVFLGLQDDTAVFAADLSQHEEDDIAPAVAPGAFSDLRKVGPIMERGQGMVLAYARGLMVWHNSQRFCSECGAPTESREAGHMHKCVSPGCGREHYPRTDPAVIMLVTRDGPDGGAALLGHKPNFPPGIYSVLAGFVDPGETLEEAVAREVMEEAGVAVTDVRYQGSQPWPFPSSLMMGFTARATTYDITFDREELEDAQWFTRADVARFAEMNRRLARTDSIARWLIETWLAKK